MLPFITSFIILIQSSSDYTLAFLTVPFLVFLTEENKINIYNVHYFFLLLILIVPIPLTKFLVPPFYTLKCFSLQVSIILLTIVALADCFSSIIKVLKSKIEVLLLDKSNYVWICINRIKTKV